MRIPVLSFCLMCFIHFGTPGYGQIIKFVKPVASGTADGSSWANASGNLKAVIDGAAPNTQIWVAAGTYKPTTTTTRTISFAMKNGVGIYGGFNGTETLLSQRKWAVNKTILSGDIGVAGNYSDNSYHVIFNNSNILDYTALLDGFTITAGKSNERGGGILNIESYPTFVNCIIAANQAIDGGGASNVSSKAQYINCSFLGNTATGTGGAVVNYKAPTPTIYVNCTFSGNKATTGGGLYNYLTNTTVTNCIIWGNSSEIVNAESAVPSVTYSIVKGGYAGTGNIAADPKFIAEPAIQFGAIGNLRLQPCSPAINAGNNGPNSTTLDLAGNARKTGTIDMGAYERAAATVAGVLFVNDNSPADDGDGSNWANAFTSLQDAISMSSCAGITEIWVAGGTYKPTTGTNRSISFVMKNNLGIYGGFAGTETLLIQRNWKTNLTLLSGDIGVIGNISDNSYHVVMNDNNGLNSTAVLDGFTLTLGNANGSGIHGGGAGMRNISSSPTISHCIFSQNTAVAGAALYNVDISSPVVNDCIFKENEVTIGGGGGALANINSSSAIITNCSFIGNKAGGAMVNNTSNPIITNCSFIGNQSNISGGGMYNFSASPVIINCSFSGNQAATTGGAIYNSHISIATISNSIFYGNSSEIFNAGLPSVVTYSIIQGGYAGTGNLDVNPQFVQQPPVGLGITGNLRLQNCSPAQDAGNDAANAGTTDFDGLPRKFNGKAWPNDIDMGAYEIQSICCPPANILYVKANATGSNNGSSWANAFTSLQDALAQTSLCANATQIWVAAGTYKPTTSNNRSISFAMKNNIAIYGGFAGTETLLAQRNWNTNLTILSGDIGAAGNNSDNSLHVIANSNLDATAILDGFQISQGNANANDDVNESGGGVWNVMASPTFYHCAFFGNVAGYGGAMANHDNSSPVITHCIFIKNSATLGGAVYNKNLSSPNITFSRFSGNRAAYSGGAINNRTNASPAITNCVFIGNSANFGGAIDNSEQSSPIITNCSFSGNVNDQADGAAIYNTQQSSPLLINCIIWGNTAAIVNKFGASPVVNFSIVEGGHGGTGNINIDPQFVLQPPIVQGTSGDLRLQTCSPAQDAGNDAANSTITDMAGNARKFGAIDMGAYELQAAKSTTRYLDVNATGSGDGSSWANAFTNLGTALAQLKDCYTTDTLLIAKGTYNTGSPFEFDKFMAVILGGFPNGGGTRDPIGNPVIIIGVVNVMKSMYIDGVKVEGQ